MGLYAISEIFPNPFAEGKTELKKDSKLENTYIGCVKLEEALYYLNESRTIPIIIIETSQSENEPHATLRTRRINKINGFKDDKDVFKSNLLEDLLSVSKKINEIANGDIIKSQETLLIDKCVIFRSENYTENAQKIALQKYLIDLKNK